MIELINTKGSITLGSNKGSVELDVKPIVTTEYVDEQIARVDGDIDTLATGLYEVALPELQEQITANSAGIVAAMDKAAADNDALAEDVITDIAELREEITADIEEVKASIPTIGDKELIASGTLTEAVNSVVISKDNNGNSFSLRDFFWIYVEMPTAAQNTRLSTSYSNSNGTWISSVQVLNGLSTTQNRNSKIIGFYTGMGWDYLLSNTVSTGEQNSVNTPTKAFHVTKHNDIGKITFYCYTASHILPVGMKYKIYGRRA